jgi:hypothetical protein
MGKEVMKFRYEHVKIVVAMVAATFFISTNVVALVDKAAPYVMRALTW